MRTRNTQASRSRSTPKVLVAAALAVIGAIGPTPLGAQTPTANRSQPAKAPVTRAPAATAPAARVDPDAVDPKAVDALRRMGAHLRSLKSFGIQADVSRDQVSVTGQKLLTSGTISYLVRPPNALRADLRTDRKQRSIYYDGKTITVHAPRVKYYATVPAPPTVIAMIDTIERKYGVEVPMADLFTWGTPRDNTKAFTSARYVGPGYVDGADVDHYAFRQPGVDWQIWIQRGANPLPRRVVITTTTEEAEPQYTANIRWNTAPVLTASTFAFTPPPGSTKIRMVPVDDVVARAP